MSSLIVDRCISREDHHVGFFGTFPLCILVCCSCVRVFVIEYSSSPDLRTKLSSLPGTGTWYQVQ